MPKRLEESSLTRRELNKMVIAGAAALATRPPQAAADPSTGWIDAHVHVWTPDTAKYPLDKAFKVADMQPPSFTPEELFSHCKPVGVTRIVLIQMNFYNFDNRYMLDVMASHPGVFSGVAIVDHGMSNLPSTMKELAGQGVRGYRIYGFDDSAAGWVHDDGMKRLWKTAPAHGQAVCPLINPTILPHVDAMCTQFPDTRVVIDHFARIGVSGKVEEDYLNTLCRLARFPNVHVKTSAFYALGKKTPPYTDLIPLVRRVVDAFGPERLMWASDCPYQVQGSHDYANSIALIRDRIDFLSPSDKQWILRGTAEKVFFS